MEKNQNLHQEPSNQEQPLNNSQSVKSSVNSTSKPNKASWQPKMIGDFLVRLLAYYPWLPIAALLLVFFGSGTLALYSLGYVGRDEIAKSESEPQQQVDVVQPIPPASPQENANPIPLWMVFAIAFSCAGGCILILRLIRRVTRPQATGKPINRYQARMAQRQQVRPPVRPAQKTSLVVPPQPQNLHRKSFVVTPAYQLNKLNINRSNQFHKPYQSSLKTNGMKTKSFTQAIPPLANQSSRPQSESLADSLDLRKQSSLSSILRRY